MVLLCCILQEYNGSLIGEQPKFISFHYTWDTFSIQQPIHAVWKILNVSEAACMAVVWGFVSGSWLVTCNGRAFLFRAVKLSFKGFFLYWLPHRHFFELRTTGKKGAKMYKQTNVQSVSKIFQSASECQINVFVLRRSDFWPLDCILIHRLLYLSHPWRVLRSWHQVPKMPK